jgi:phosphoribosylformylglycinamidine cyclo-ligase
VAEACRACGCVLLGGEMAELPGMYKVGEYDLVGFALGVVEREAIIDGSAVEAGDVLLGLASCGLHSNGYSLARKALLEVAGFRLDEVIPELGCALGEELLRPTRLYTPALVKVLASVPRPHGLAHITGGGLAENLARCIPDGLCAVVEKASFPVPPVFGLIQRVGHVADAEMQRTFNMGLGMVAVCAAGDAEALKAALEAAGEKAYVIGRVEESCEGGGRARLA